MTSESDLTAALPQGIAEEDFRRAVSTSGYPLQISVAAVLKQRGFDLQEEFAFKDSDEGSRRTLDIVGHRWAEPFESSRGRSTFGTTVLIECKQSRHPLVLFEAVSPPSLHRFPRLIGYPKQDVYVSNDPEAGSVTTVPVMAFFNSLHEEFITQPPVAASMSRAVPNGKKVILSGEESYRALTMPLLKATNAVTKYWRESSAEKLLLRSIFPIAVVDCPLIFVGQPAVTPTIEPRPWIRLAVRDMMSGAQDLWEPLGVEIIDVVHSRYLVDYLDDGLLPFASAIRERACGIHDEFIAGSVTIPGLDWSQPPKQPLYKQVSKG